jgi:hypothetical protein
MRTIVHTPHSQLEAVRLAKAEAIENTSPAIALLLLLICADAGFTLLHLINVETGWLRAAAMSLEADGGPAETYQYVKEFWVVVCLVFAFVSTRHAAYVSWALVFLFLLVDDATQVHERMGAWLGQRYALPGAFGLSPNHVGELLFAGAVGVSTLAVVGAAVRRGTSQCRRISRDLLCLIFVLALLGVVIDAIHVIAYVKGSLLAQVLLVVEDGGEMVVLSALTAYAFHVASHAGRTHFDLWSIVRARLVRSLGQETSSTAQHGWSKDRRAKRSA